MAPPKKPWFRTYVEMLHDPKLRRVKPEARWVWIAVLAGARMSHRPGYLYVSEGIPMEARDLAELAGVSVRSAVDAVGSFLDMRMLGVEPDGEGEVWFVPKWDVRQFESDDSTPRARKSRDATAMQRPINGDATHQRQTTETESETEAESDAGCTETTDDLQSVGPSSVVVEVAHEMAELLWRHTVNVHPSKHARWVESTQANIARERALEIDQEAIRHPHLDAAALATGIVDGVWPQRLRAVPDVEDAWHGPPAPVKPPMSQDDYVAGVRARAEAGDETARSELVVWERRAARKALQALGGSR